MRLLKSLLFVIGFLIIPIACEALDKNYIPKIESCEKFANKDMNTWADLDGLRDSMRERALEICRAAHEQINDELNNISYARIQMGDAYKYNLGDDAVANLWYMSAYNHAKNFPLARKDLRRMNIIMAAYKQGLANKDFPQDYGTAFQYFLESAKLGGNAAQYELGLAYKNGLGTVKNYVESYAWLNICASNSYSDKIKAAKAEMEMLESLMTQNAIEKAQELSKKYYEEIYAKKELHNE